MQEFVKAMRGRDPLPVTFDEAEATVRLTQAITSKLLNTSLYS